MTRAQKIFTICVVGLIGLWGCSQGGSTKTTSKQDERLKALELKCAKLEADLQSALLEREDTTKKLTDAEKDKAQLARELTEHKLILKERNELKVHLATRTSERDAYQLQLEELRKGIRILLTQVESSPPSTGEKTTQNGPSL